MDIVALLVARPDSASVSIRESSSRQTVTLRTDSQTRLWVNDSCRLLHQASLCDSPDASSWVAIGASSPTLSINGYICREPVATKRVQFISLGIEPISNEFRCNILYEEANKVFSDSSFGTGEDKGGPDDAEKKLDGFTGKELKARKGVDRWPMFFLKISPTSQMQKPLGIDEILDDRQPSLALITDLLKAMFYEFLKKNHCRPRRVNLPTRPKLRSQDDNCKSPRLNDVARKNRSSSAQSPNLVSGNEPAGKAPRLENLDSISDSPFGAWSKIKSGQLLRTFQESAPPRSQTQSTSTTPTHGSRNSTPGYDFDTELSISATPAESSQPPLYDANGKLTRMPFEEIGYLKSMSLGLAQLPRLRSGEKPSQSSTDLPQDEMFDWVNPATKIGTTINSRTGFAMAPKPLTLSRRASEAKFRKPNLDPEGMEPTMNTSSRETTPWIRDLVSKWKNPVFEPTEAPIPKLPDVSETLGLDPRPGGHHCHHGQAAFTIGTRHDTSAMGLQGRLSKDNLRKAQLIAQVDKKFIFAKLPFDRVKGGTDHDAIATTSSSVLVLIDQHAADERCRVEELMQEYFKPTTDANGSHFWMATTQVLSKPVQFELSATDRNVLGRFQKYFGYWGICYDIETPAPTDIRIKNQVKKRWVEPNTIVSVHSLPPTILERCRTEPRLLVDLIRKEAWRLNDESLAVSHPRPVLVFQNKAEGDVPVWVSLFHGCPPGIVELINSRSCRSTPTSSP